MRLTRIAYWIAFGNHGPRALPPPGENWKVAGYTFLGIAVSFVLFSSIRMFAGPAPGTMNKEYQEATNEYLRVLSPCPLFLFKNSKLIHGITGTKLRTYLRSLVRRLRWARPSPERTKEKGVEGWA